MSSPTVQRPRHIVWRNVITVISAAVLIGAEVFGAAFAGGWAIASLFGLGTLGVYALQAIFFALGLLTMAQFVRGSMKIEPFTQGG